MTATETITIIILINLILFIFYSCSHHRDLHSLPTRRSSDLEQCHDPPARPRLRTPRPGRPGRRADARGPLREEGPPARSEEHTSELHSHSDLVCRLLLEKKKY